eukprot:CAMPEP_0174361236 /NCGR_PEP_ID=MMETSP0811_2-20130205/58246_1 /TAXON_ID=73025 ORGANISM="Eutreptiella gymnastica-like, Strain CCMP1594" /NCGR_SAMPLE_ID=MMETSP0811_2 /ASSEMBLY_ACC=CAM_ASM_000667 /LENGTH=33 /DNA_ID= /DNA_START= /DNA_END= /DNA_ORIENTATION=
MSALDSGPAHEMAQAQAQHSHYGNCGQCDESRQ